MTPFSPVSKRNVGRTAFQHLRRARGVAALSLVVFLAPMFPRSARADNGSPAEPSSLTGQASLSATNGTTDHDAGFSPATVDPATGSLRTTIPFALPAARGSVQPQLALNYSSNGVVGVGGRGWLLGTPSIERHNPSGPPQFNDPAATAILNPQQMDRFTFAGEPLVMICRITAGGACDTGVPVPGVISGEVLPPFATAGGWYYYRLQTENGSLLRFFWSADHTRWVVQDNTGAMSEYGVPAGTTDTTSADRDVSGNIFRWNLFTQYDSERIASGTPTNRVLYTWTQERQRPGIGASLGYLTDVYDTPPPGNTAPVPGSYAHHTHLVYTPPASAAWSPSANAPVWLARPTWLLSRVDVTSQDLTAASQRQQVRRYFLTYGTAADAALSVGSVQLEGNCPAAQNNFEDPTTFLLPDPSAGTACVRQQTRPPTTFTYRSESYASEAVAMPSITDGTKAPLLFDLNADGLPDFIDVTAPKPVVWMNSLSTPNTFTSEPISLGATNVLNLTNINQLAAPFSLGVGSFQMDGRLDLLWNTEGEWHNPSGVGGATPSGYAMALCPTPNEALYCDPTMSYALLNASQANGTWTLMPAQTGTFVLGAEWPANSSDVIVRRGVGDACTTPPCLLGGEQTIATIDMNGDGLADLLNVIEYVDQTNNPFQYWWQYTIRFSKRSFDGTYWPFYGSSSPGATAGAKTQVCVGGVSGESQLSPPLVWNQGQDDSAQNQFADLDGDGITDLIQAGGGSTSMTWWPGHGDGVFGVCTDGTVRCDCASSKSVMFNLNLPTNPGLVFGVHDVTGDGLADVVVSNVNGGGFLIYENIGGSPLQFAPGLPMFFGGNLGFTKAPTAIYFADMDGNGIDDVVLQAPKTGGPSSATGLGFVDMHGVGNGPNSDVNTTSIREGALTDVDNGLGAHVHVTYDSVANLARAAASAGTPWANLLPMPMHVVTSLTTSDSTGDSYTTTYSYWNPIFDGRDHEFLGFQRVRQTTPGDTTTLMNVDTTYFYGACGSNQPTACTAGPDYLLESYRGLPTLVEVFDGNVQGKDDLRSATYLSTTHHSYATTPLYYGVDGRVVRRMYDAKTDTFLYDTSPYVSHPHQVSIPDVDIPSYTASLLVRSLAQQVETTRSLDTFGNITTVTDLGNITTPDPSIVQTTTWAVSANSDPTNAWIWRAQSVSTVDPATGASRLFTQQYDAYGNMTDRYATISGVQPLARAAGGAPPPASASNDGIAHFMHITYDLAGTGNPATVTMYPSSTKGSTAGRCTEYTYDTPYSQLLTMETVDVGGCASPSQMVTQHGWDRVLGLEVFGVAPSGARSARTYDGLGRLTSWSKPDLTVGFSDVETTITYADTSYGQLVHSNQVGGSQNGGDGTEGFTYAPFDTFVFNDALGRTLQVVSTGDTQNQWALSGQVTRDVRGRVTAAFVPAFVSVTAGKDGSSVPIAPPTGARRTVVYDAFSRPTQTADIDGTLTSKPSYHAISVDSYDAENLNASSAHAGQYVTTTWDGHGRTTAVAARGNGGTITTQATYQATGEATTISRSGADVNGTVSYERYMQYDSLGRLVVNAEPNASQNYAPITRLGTPGSQEVWTYAYDDLGDLVGTSDPRGCGENVAYDGAGRILSEDYSPCDATAQSPYTQASTTLGDGDGTETYYVYEGSVLKSGLLSLQSGLLSDIYDRASHAHFTHDARGRVTEVDRQIANPGTPPAALASRYSPTVFTMSIGYDDRDRVATQSTGADVPELQSTNAAFVPHFGPSTIGATYSARGNLQSVEGSYGKLVTGAVFEADGRPDSMSYGDAAQTTVAYTYGDARRRLTGLAISRAGSFPAATSTYSPPVAQSAEPTQQRVLASDVLAYDGVGNPLTITDARLDAEWPVGSKPVLTRSYVYDDAYRVTSVTSTFAATVDRYTPPLASNMPNTSPLPMSLVTDRVRSQTFKYDGLGNTLATTDEANIFFDRSLGAITNGSGSAGGASTGGPNQLLSATLAASAGASAGTLAANYDASGNLSQLTVQRNGACTSGTSCYQQFEYAWDEVGRLSGAVRYDTPAPAPCTGRFCPQVVIPRTPAASVQYAYDAGGSRVLRTGQDDGGTPTYSAEIFPSLRLNHSTWDPGTSLYERTEDTEAVYLVLGGASYGRVVSDASLPNLTGPQHVFLQLTDELNSTTTVIDKDTSELVERTTYLAYGGLDTDYRPERWNSFREDYKFTGKEEDVELGLIYFGARYYCAPLGRWISPDPLAIHGLAGDLNPYAYVHGHVATDTDPFGLDDPLPDPPPEPPPPPPAQAASLADLNLPTGDTTIVAAVPGESDPTGSQIGGSADATQAERVAGMDAACHGASCHTEVDPHPWTMSAPPTQAERMRNLHNLLTLPVTIWNGPENTANAVRTGQQGQPSTSAKDLAVWGVATVAAGVGGKLLGGLAADGSTYVYQLVDEGGDVVYYGISNDPARRLAQHALEATKPFSGMQVISEGQPLAQAQALETSLIQQAHAEGRLIYNVAPQSISPFIPVQVPSSVVPSQTLLNPVLYSR